MSEMTLEEKVQRALDYQEIQNVMSAHTYCYAAQKQWYELDNFWSKREDIAYGTMHMGRKAVRAYYGATNERSRKEKLKIMAKLFPDVKNSPANEGIGDLVLHLTTTPYVEIARDGKTAKGLWYSPGICSEIGHEGEPVIATIWEKCGVDFIKEDGKWKIWHFRQYGDFGSQLDKSLLDSTRPMPPRTAFPAPEGKPGQKMPQPLPPPYSIKRVAEFAPELPQPYETWDDSLSYVK